MLTMGSLFDGIGGFPLAAVRNGIEPVWASEIEKFPIEVTKIRFPNMLHLGDITKINGAKIPPVDIITAGSPCQDLSVAGKRAGLEGQRSGLFMEQIRIIKEMRNADVLRGHTAESIRPRYSVWENVPGAFSSNGYKDFQAVLEETVRIADSRLSVPRPPKGAWKSAGCILGDEFSVAWRVLDAQHWGVAQRRKRIFLVADFGGFTASKILFEQDSLFGNTPQSQSERESIATTTGESTKDSSRTGVDELSAFHINQREEVIDLNGISGALMATRTMQMQTFIKEPFYCLCDQGGQRMDISDNLTGTLLASNGHVPIVMGSSQPNAEICLNLSPTITSSSGSGGNNTPLLFENNACDARYKGPLQVAPTLAAQMGTGFSVQDIHDSNSHDTEE